MRSTVENMMMVENYKAYQTNMRVFDNLDSLLLERSKVAMQLGRNPAPDETIMQYLDHLNDSIKKLLNIP